MAAARAIDGKASAVRHDARAAPGASARARDNGAVPGSPFRAVADGVLVAVKLTPKAAQDRIQQVATAADGSAVLKLAVTAAPERGKANEALVKLLAKTWKLPKTSIVLVHGAGDRRKTLHLAGEPQALMARLEAWSRETPRETNG